MLGCEKLSLRGNTRLNFIFNNISRFNFDKLSLFPISFSHSSRNSWKVFISLFLNLIMIIFCFCSSYIFFYVSLLLGLLLLILLIIWSLLIRLYVVRGYLLLRLMVLMFLKCQLSLVLLLRRILLFQIGSLLLLLLMWNLIISLLSFFAFHWFIILTIHTQSLNMNWTVLFILIWV